MLIACSLLVAVLSFSMTAMVISLTCPSSCSFISPVPYPFGAAPGCGAPGFQISNCSSGTPQWNLQLGDTSRNYFIKSINASPNSTNHSSVLSYGYGGSILLSLVPKNDTPFCQIDKPIYSLTAFSSSNLYAFDTADLSFYQDRYLLFNCSAMTDLQPTSGVITWSSTACMTYLKYCNFSSTHPSLEYTPDKELYLSTLLTTYNCSFYRRFVIANDIDPVESWITGTQFIWGPAKDADSCSRCQNTSGICGYNTQDNSFRCYCGDETYQTDCGSSKESGSKPVIVSASCGAVIFLLAVASAAFYLHQKHYYWRVFGNHERLKLDGLNQAPIEFPYAALAVATKSFGTEIGRGAFGRVYKGKLPDGNEMAVKVLDASMSQSNEQFVNEVSTIGNIHHVNVARLFGFCVRGSNRILVYEYVSNGSLDKYLFSCKQPSDMVVLSWKQRFNIALGVARGLSYMHEECRSCIIHRDIKPQNILLDAAFCPKIADFGLARLLTWDESRVLTHARGTPGYVAPEFWSLGTGPLTAKFDVYSYGMMLLEIVRGKRSFHQFDPFSLEELEEGLDEFVSVSVDERIADEADLEQAQVCTQVALWCIQEDASMRPAMSRVVQYLQGTVPVPSNPPMPFRKDIKLEGSSQSKRISSQ